MLKCQLNALGIATNEFQIDPFLTFNLNNCGVIQMADSLNGNENYALNNIKAKENNIKRIVNRPKNQIYFAEKMAIFIKYQKINKYYFRIITIR